MKNLEEEIVDDSRGKPGVSRHAVERRRRWNSGFDQGGRWLDW